MIVRCNHCNQPIYLTWLQPKEHRAARENFLREIGQPVKTGGFWSKLKNWATKEEECSETFYDGKRELVCPICRKETRIRTDNVISFQQGDTGQLGITWRHFCIHCNQIVESIPLKVGQKDHYELITCPLCRNTNMRGEHIPGYQGGSEDIGLSDSEALAKKYFYFVKSLLAVCCMSRDRFQEDDFLLFDDLGETLIDEALSSGELDFSKVTANWQSIAASFEKLRERFEQLNIVSAEQINRNRQEWDDLKDKMSSLDMYTREHCADPVAAKRSVGRRFAEAAPKGNAGREFAERVKKHPELANELESALKKVGDDPVPRIIHRVIAGGQSLEEKTMASLLIIHVGEPAIPHLIDLLGHEDPAMGQFAACTLAGIEGSLTHVKRALNSQNPRVRLHAAGSLQYFGIEARQLIPELRDFIKREIADGGKADSDEMPEAAGLAASALGRIGDLALPMFGELLKDDNVNVRLAAVSGLWRMGRPALPLLIEARSREKDPLVFTGLQKTIDAISEK